MDKDHSVATAVAVKDDKIVYVGDDAGAKKLIGDGTKVIELNGEMVLPGFVDSHIHAASGWIADMFQCNLALIEPVEADYLAAVKAFSEKNPDLKVIIGQSFQVKAFGDNGPTKEALDAIVSDRPVVISDTSQHSTWANSKAIEMAGITKDTPDPDGGKIYRAADGSASGYFADVFMFNDILALGATTLEQYEAAWMEWQKEANSFGVTSFSDGGILAGTTFAPEERWAMVDRLKNEGKLTLRANMSVIPTPNDASDEALEKIIKLYDDNQKYNSDYQVVRTVKAFIDGVVEGRTGLLLEPYDAAAGTAPDYKGVPIWSQENLNKLVAAVDKAGYSMHMHTIADGSTRMGIDAIENAIKTNGTKGSRHVQTHITIMDPSDISRMADLGIIAAMQPTWFYRDPVFSQLEEQMLGKERFARMYVIKDMLDAGIKMTGSADYNVLPDYRPLSGIEAATTQCSPYEGQDTDPAYVRNADQAATLMQMLEAYTINGAYQMGMEDKIGSIEVGKLADLVVLAKDLTKLELKDIAETQVLTTMIGGKIVFDAAEAKAKG
ncbi:MAG: amidohydrolase family protein [Clostridia bacterium]